MVHKFKKTGIPLIDGGLTIGKTLPEDTKEQEIEFTAFYKRIKAVILLSKPITGFEFLSRVKKTLK